MQLFTRGMIALLLIGFSVSASAHKFYGLVKYGDYENEGTRVPKLNLYSANSRCWIDNYSDWAVCHFAIKSLSDISSDPEIIVFPDIPMGASISIIPTEERKSLMANVADKGFETPTNASTTSMRAFLNMLIDQVQPCDACIDVLDGDVTDIE